MNKDIETRDKIIFGEYDPEKYKYGGVRRFECKATVMQELIKNDFVDLYDAQNNSPSIDEFMEYIDGIEEYVTFECYAVDITRHDYRVSIEGIQVLLPKDKRDDFYALIETFRYADEFCCSEDNECCHLRAWWD